jgi:hypothetical protein
MEGGMNKAQRIVFMATLIINTTMAMFPPYIKYYNVNDRVGSSGGYRFIFNSPYAHINLLTLSIQIFIITIVGVSLIYYFKSLNKPTINIDKAVRDTIEALAEGDEERAVESLKKAIGR